MINAVGAPQSLLLLGGTSDIALAIARKYARSGLRVVLAARPSDRRTAAATELTASAARSPKLILMLVIMNRTRRPSSRPSPAVTSTSP